MDSWVTESFDPGPWSDLQRQDRRRYPMATPDGRFLDRVGRPVWLDRPFDLRLVCLQLRQRQSDTKLEFLHTILLGPMFTGIGPFFFGFSNHFLSRKIGQYAASDQLIFLL